MPAKKYKFMDPKYREILQESHKRYYQKNREKILAQNKLYSKNNHKYLLAYKRQYWKENLLFQKQDTFNAMGNRCIICNFSDKRALQIDHVNGNGKQDKNARSNRIQYLRQVKESYLAGENKYQLLCANCNWIKKHENQESTK